MFGDYYILQVDFVPLGRDIKFFFKETVLHEFIGLFLVNSFLIGVFNHVVHPSKIDFSWVHPKTFVSSTIPYHNKSFLEASFPL